MTNAEIIKAKAQMCKEVMCGKCPLSHFNNGENMDCNDFMLAYPNEAVEDIEHWKSQKATNAVWWANHFKSLGIALDPNEFKKECPRIFKGDEKCPQTGEAIGIVVSCFDCQKWWDEEYQGDKK